MGRGSICSHLGLPGRQIYRLMRIVALEVGGLKPACRDRRKCCNSHQHRFGRIQTFLQLAQAVEDRDLYTGKREGARHLVSRCS